MCVHVTGEKVSLMVAVFFSKGHLGSISSRYGSPVICPPPN